jgi:hypothetical protein
MSRTDGVIEQSVLNLLTGQVEVVIMTDQGTQFAPLWRHQGSASVAIPDTQPADRLHFIGFIAAQRLCT